MKKKTRTIQLLGGSKDGSQAVIPEGVNLDSILVSETNETYEPQTELERLTGVWTLVTGK
jgi:hypothetical protein